MLAKFHIDKNSVLDGDGTQEVKFSLVSNATPTAFNLYYTKSANLKNKDNWTLIDSNIPTDLLQPEIYNTQYTDNRGNAIEGKTYTYNWKFGRTDLTNIHIIVEQIY